MSRLPASSSSTVFASTPMSQVQLLLSSSSPPLLLSSIPPLLLSSSLHSIASTASASVIAGGESFLIDSFAVAESLRRSHPEAFATLCSIPATFLKDHSKRENPVLLSYQRPHFAVDPRTARLTGVFWSPPFEGPLRGVSPAQVEAYYSAYRVLHEAIDAAPRWEARMDEGEMLVFNNRRMLHGRRAFEAPLASTDGARHLRGGYVNIDEFANAYNLLRRKHGGGGGSAPAIGNQDWASGAIDLPVE